MYVSNNRSLSCVKPILSVAADTETSRPTLIAASGNKEAIRPSQKSSRKFDYSSRLPMGWKETLASNDINWIAHSLFATKGVLVCKLKTWWFPPEIPGPQENKIPLVSDYFQRRLFLWMPRKMWASEFKCPYCPIVHSLTLKGLYNRVWSAIDLKNCYYLATEYLQCSSCKGTFLSYDYRFPGSTAHLLDVHWISEHLISVHVAMDVI
ncbi:hypothetical protein DAPPUDRAFT_253580 [Daphnia pulex]|uniref:DUF6729 domain-containing protein n=1 Tax=Daphnia pulex TaxID=6669 RepID=E9H552_DAPPU|nr:hypothetical protein DAPPUDRAFT_253580 [Daphnia pulex]|eukprot:EFX73138.1 hypothetical protein DAPPUDRAFT_253580 [Daphnia pulex]